MHIVVERRDEDEIIARVSYGDPYRFRLWLAAVEDTHSLGMGFRAYHSHIGRSLEGWIAQGTRFIGENGKPLNADLLTQDDLWGFLGKQDEQPRGPKRRINDLKIAVLDVYFKKRYPLLAETFARSGVPTDVTAILKTFFEGGLAQEASADFVQPWHGVYVARLNIDPLKVIHAARAGELRSFAVTAIMVRPSERSDSCIVHRVEIPLRAEFLKPDTENAENLKKVSRLLHHHRPAATLISSGIAMVSRPLSDGNTKLSCILRDRTTYAPATTDLVIGRWTDGLSETSRRTMYAFEYNDSFLAHSYTYCGPEQNYATKRQFYSTFNQPLFDELWRLYDTLGDEV